MLIEWKAMLKEVFVGVKKIKFRKVQSNLENFFFNEITIKLTLSSPHKEPFVATTRKETFGNKSYERLSIIFLLILLD
jgi:hypothetical protein